MKKAFVPIFIIFLKILKNTTLNLKKKPVTEVKSFEVKKMFLSQWKVGPKPIESSIKIYQIVAQHLLQEYSKTHIKIYQKRKITLEMSLFHGTSEANLRDIFKYGFIPPSDFAPDPHCEKSGHLASVASACSLCDVRCQFCTKKHVWNRCHMFGLGVYFANQSSKCNQYISDMNRNKTAKKGRKMLYCTVELGQCECVEELQTADQMHDRTKPCKGCDSIYVMAHKPPIPKDANGNILAVLNDEYVIFHPHQALPEYLIEFDMP